jgi:hypothetical protein
MMPSSFSQFIRANFVLVGGISIVALAFASTFLGHPPPPHPPQVSVLTPSDRALIGSAVSLAIAREDARAPEPSYQDH